MIEPQAPRASPAWHARADAWFKLLGAIVLGYLILERLAGIVRDFGDVAVIAIGGVLLAYVVFPLVRSLNERLPLWGALTIVYAAGALILLSVLYLVLPPGIDQLQGFISNVPRFERQIVDWLNNPLSPVQRLPDPVRSYVLKLPQQAANFLTGNISEWTNRVFTIIISVAGIAALAVAVPIVSIYMLAEATEIRRLFARAIPDRRREYALRVLDKIDLAIGGFVRGQVIVALCVAVLSVAALLILHVPYALLIGVWAGIADVVPYVGPFAGGVPAGLVALAFNGWQNCLFVCIAFIIINQIEAHLLGPRIVARTVKVTPLIVIFALLIGAHIFGFIGLIIGVPLAGVIRVLLLELLPDRTPTNAQIRPALTNAPQTDVEPQATHT